MFGKSKNQKTTINGVTTFVQVDKRGQVQKIETLSPVPNTGSYWHYSTQVPGHLASPTVILEDYEGERLLREWSKR